ncbi:peptidase S10 [Oleiagrimonas sp. C23AA]|uniref:S10 family peptidase n=1 Tax=Oleiagrimonas sp. C23AA TaxID=2719047 RepID=UPI00141E20B9|nr:peptidase S10 [Oleiagrimonas sp. C23AA]NII10769.1 peptidase S10 [Oleiagrimonas sp. C23AA]
MRKRTLCTALAALCLTSGLAVAAPASDAGAGSSPEQAAMQALAKPQTSTTSGSVTVEGKRIEYTAKAGTIVLHGSGDEANTPTVRMFYVAYFKKGADAAKRPVTFLYNGGPGSSSMWLHMGAFGPHRVVTKDDTHTPAAPYQLTNNDYSLLDASDLVFIDAPGTGFSRLIAEADSKDKRDALMKQRKKTYYSVDGDGHAFAQFITDFLSQYGRWNSPKYLFGESYGTTRSAVLSNILTNEDNVDLNGVVLLSQILNFDTSIDGPDRNPGVDLPYELALPTYAATAWYHHKLPNRPADLEPFLKEVEQFASGAYAHALMQGSALSDAERQSIAEKLHQYTGLPTAYWLKANLRVDGGQFEKNLLADSDDSTGRLDARFAGPSIDPLSESSEYDPQSSAISSAYVSLFNDYVRKDLKFGQHAHYRLFADIDHWDFKHNAPGVGGGFQATTNVLPDLAMAMKTDPDMKVMLNGGYYDLATPFYAAEYEMHHLPIPKRLDKNISYDFYPSGHMVYAHVPSLKKLHDNVVRFIDATDNLH